ncbi:MAG TPA: metalloenzyme, partial [Thermoanaerobaculia bacterium]|nr:metalloenzyme [Thermoanaerobaculia bacterium]
MALAALDAVLGVAGLPQSGTGQTALFTGVNAQAAIGHHVPALPGPRLRALIDEHSVLKRLAAAGHEVTFANAYTADYAERLVRGEARASATTRAVLAAGIPLRTLADLDAGEAATWDIDGSFFVRRAGVPVAPIAPALAGERLARLAGRHRFTLYETFL